jgi:probable HAF family extracellular repeat protein
MINRTSCRTLSARETRVIRPGLRRRIQGELSAREVVIIKTSRITIVARTVGSVSTQARRRGAIAVLLAALAAVVVVTGPARAEAATSPPGTFIDQNGRYTPIGSVNGLPTDDTSINDSDQVAGSYTPDGGTARGFIRAANGRYTTFAEAPGVLTVPIHINDTGWVAGFYATTAANGFVRSPRGTITTVDVPGASQTELAGINDRGAVVGAYAGADGQVHGFLLENGVLTNVDPPGAAGSTAALGINNQGQIVGFYADVSGTYHGYLYQHGTFTTIDPPGAANVANFATTAPLGINNLGQVVGQYVDSASVLHGYLWQPGRGFTTINPPQIVSFTFPVPGAGTVAADINDRDQILLPAPGTDFQGRA